MSAAALFGTACGDDDGGSPDANTNPDAPSAADANVDAAPVVATRSGTVALTEVRLLSTDTPTNLRAIGGSAISISYDDLTTSGGTVVVPGTTPGCSVVSYDCPKGDCPFADTVDVGAHTITNTNAGTPGLIGPAPLQCNVINGAYRCPTGAPLAALGGTFSRDGSIIELSFTGQTFNANLRGTWVVASGFAGPFAALNGTALPVVAVVDADTFRVAVPGSATVPSTDITGIGLTFFQGIGPVPGGANPAGPIDFLSNTDPATETVRIQRAANAAAGYPTALDVTLGPAGEGFVLAPTCAPAPPNGPGSCITPLTFPTELEAGADPDAVNFRFSCDAAGGNCGATGQSPVPGAFALSGTATNGSTDGLDPFAMPTDGTKFVQFSCTAIGPNILIPNKVIAAVLAIEPTRIESRVLRIAAPLPIEDPVTRNVTRVVVGHGFVGHTDVPQGKAN
jgi:hypothetical protein